jgi:hypothetical protein
MSRDDSDEDVNRYSLIVNRTNSWKIRLTNNDSRINEVLCNAILT